METITPTERRTLAEIVHTHHQKSIDKLPHHQKGIDKLLWPRQSDYNGNTIVTHPGQYVKLGEHSYARKTKNDEGIVRFFHQLVDELCGNLETREQIGISVEEPKYPHDRTYRATIKANGQTIELRLRNVQGEEAFSAEIVPGWLMQPSYNSIADATKPKLDNIRCLAYAHLGLSEHYQPKA